MSLTYIGAELRRLIVARAEPQICQCATVRQGFVRPDIVCIDARHNRSSFTWRYRVRPIDKKVR